MKLADVLKKLLEAKKKYGDQIECVVYTLGHGPFEVGCNIVKEDRDTKTHIEFVPDDQVNPPEIDKEDSEEGEE